MTNVEEQQEQLLTKALSSIPKNLIAKSSVNPSKSRLAANILSSLTGIDPVVCREFLRELKVDIDYSQFLTNVTGKGDNQV